MTWRDVEDDLADMWDGAAYWWNKVAKLQKPSEAPAPVPEEQDAAAVVDKKEVPNVE